MRTASRREPKAKERGQYNGAVGRHSLGHLKVPKQELLHMQACTTSYHACLSTISTSAAALPMLDRLLECRHQPLGSVAAGSSGTSPSMNVCKRRATS
jgi:hypothetical protein